MIATGNWMIPICIYSRELALRQDAGLVANPDSHGVDTSLPAADFVQFSLQDKPAMTCLRMVCQISCLDPGLKD